MKLQNSSLLPPITEFGNCKQDSWLQQFHNDRKRGGGDEPEEWSDYCNIMTA